MKINFAGCLAIGSPQGLQQRIGFGYNVKAHFVELDVPGRPGGPGDKLVVPGAFGALEIVIPQPLNTGGQALGLFDGMVVFG